jgi:hypothetical protein
VRRERMAERVAAHTLGHARPSGRSVTARWTTDSCR